MARRRVVGGKSDRATANCRKSSNVIAARVIQIPWRLRDHVPARHLNQNPEVTASQEVWIREKRTAPRQSEIGAPQLDFRWREGGSFADFKHARFELGPSLRQEFDKPGNGTANPAVAVRGRVVRRNAGGRNVRRSSDYVQCLDKVLQ